MEQPNTQKQPLFFFGLFVIILLTLYKLTVWDPYFGKPQQPAQPAAVATPAGSTPGTIPAVPAAPGVAAPNTVAPNIAAQVPGAATVPQPTYPATEQVFGAGTIEIENNTTKTTLSLLGGRVAKLTLNEYSTTLQKGSPRLNLIEHSEGSPYPLGVYGTDFDDTWVQYRQVTPAGPGPFRVVRGTELAVVLEGDLSEGRKIRKTVTFQDTGYIFSVAVSVSPEAGPQPIELEWSRKIAHDSPSWLDHYGSSGFVWFDGNASNRSMFYEAPEGTTAHGQATWIAQADKYFSIALLSGVPKTSLPARTIHFGENFRTRLSSSEPAPTFRVFGGPNSYRMLKGLNENLELLINFGRLMFLCAPLLSLMHFFYDLFHNYGLAIIALTIVVKLLLLPLTSASFKSMKAMQELQPEVEKLRKTITDKQQQQLALMELYKKRGVNPLGGCLPVVIQLPIFLGLYSALNLAIELRHSSFALWINDLSEPEWLHLGPIQIPVMVLLLVISMLVQQWTTPSAMDPTQKKIMMVLPIVFGFMFMNFPAGLTLYWLVGNIVSIGQTYALRHGGRSPTLITLGVSLLTLAVAFVLTIL